MGAVFRGEQNTGHALSKLGAMVFPCPGLEHSADGGSLVLSGHIQSSRVLSTVLKSQGLHESASKHSCLHTTHSPWHPTAREPWPVDCLLRLLLSDTSALRASHLSQGWKGRKNLPLGMSQQQDRSQELSGIQSHLSSRVPTSVQAYGSFMFFRMASKITVSIRS